MLRSYSVPPRPLESLPTLPSTHSLSSSASTASLTSIATTISSNGSHFDEDELVPSASSSMDDLHTPSSPSDAGRPRPSWQKDATEAFNGGINRHTKRAKQLLMLKRVARLEAD